MPTSDPTVQWFLARDGKPHGPMSAAEMAKVVELRHLRESDLVWRPGFAEWLPAFQVFPPQPDPVPEPASAAPAPAPPPAGSAFRPADQPVAEAQRAPSPAAPAPEPAWVMPEQQLPASRPGPRPATAGGHPETLRPGHAAGPMAGPRSSPLQFDVAPEIDLTAREGRRPFAREAVAPKGGRAALWVGGGMIVLALLAVSGLVIHQRMRSGTPGGTPQAASATKSAAGPAAQSAPAPVKAAPPPVAQPKPLPVLPVDAIDRELQASAIWKLAKAEFPEWYAARLQDVARLRADRKDEAAVTKHLAEQIVLLRRQSTLHALAASPAKLRRVAEAFHANLAGLARHSPEACFGFISLGELSPIVLKLARSQDHAPHLDAQVLSVLEAIVDGRRQKQDHRQPSEQDYNVLSKELRGRGWTDADLKLFADARALSQTPPDRVCRMVQDWFAGQLAVKDQAVQIRLLVEALRPIVAG